MCLYYLNISCRMSVFCGLMEFNSCELQELNIFNYFSKKNHVWNVLLMLLGTVFYIISFFLTALGTTFECSYHSLTWHNTCLLLVIINCRWAFFLNILLTSLDSYCSFLEEVTGFPDTMCHWKHAAREQVGSAWLILEKLSLHMCEITCLWLLMDFCNNQEEFQSSVPRADNTDLYKNTCYLPLASAFLLKLSINRKVSPHHKNSGCIFVF